jgi:hypothetical protein
MPIYHDPQLDALAIAKCDQGARADIKASSDQVRVTGDSDVIIRTWKEADADGAIESDFYLTFVKIPQALAYFRKPIHEVRPLIENAQPKIKGKVTQKTLAKMVAIRINRLREEIDLKNQSEENHYQFQLKNPQAYGGRTIVKPTPHTFLGDIDSIEKLAEEHQRWAKANTWGGERLWKKIQKELLNKPELTDQDVKDGFGMVLAGMVMEE